MLTNMKSALIAWCVSAVLVGIVYVTAELVYSPEDAETASEGAANPEAEAAETEAKSETASDSDTAEAAPIPDIVESLPPPDYTHRDEDIIENARQGDLPKVTPEGKRASEVYASRGPSEDILPRISVILTEVGLRSRMTQRALDNLPSEVTLAFSPYGSKLDEWAEKSRTKGHELLLMVPMEPVNFPQADPGPLALLVNQSPRTNVELFRTTMGRMTGYVGVINHMGSSFTTVEESMRPFLTEVARRGLIFVDARSTQYSKGAALSRGLRIPTVINNRYIDRDLSPEAVMQQLTELENRARALGAAVGVGRVTPLAINTIVTWSEGLAERGFILVPVTHITDRQPLPR